MPTPITIRVAQPHEGVVVKELYEACGGAHGDYLDWSEVFPYWLIGDVDGIPSGIVMAGPGKPFGRVDFLYTIPSLSKRHKALLSRDLGFAAAETCRRLGASAVVSTIRLDEPSWKKIAQKRGWVPMCDGTFLIKFV